MSILSSLSESMFISRDFDPNDPDSENTIVHMPIEDDLDRIIDMTSYQPFLGQHRVDTETSATLTDGISVTVKSPLRAQPRILDEKTLWQMEYLKIESGLLTGNIPSTARPSPPGTPISSEEDITEIDLSEVIDPFTLSPVPHGSPLSCSPTFLRESLRIEEQGKESKDEDHDGDVQTNLNLENVNYVKTQLIEQLKIDLLSKDTEISFERSRIVQLEREKKALSSEVDEIRDRVENISRELREKDEENERLEGEKNATEEVNAELGEKNRQLEEENRSLEERSTRLESERKLRIDTQKRLEEVSSRMEEKERELDRKLETLRDLKKDMKERERRVYKERKRAINLLLLLVNTNKRLDERKLKIEERERKVEEKERKILEISSGPQAVSLSPLPRIAALSISPSLTPPTSHPIQLSPSKPLPSATPVQESFSAPSSPLHSQKIVPFSPHTPLIQQCKYPWMSDPSEPRTISLGSFPIPPSGSSLVSTLPISASRIVPSGSIPLTQSRLSRSTIRERIRDRAITLEQCDIDDTKEMFSYALTGKKNIDIQGMSVNLNEFIGYIVKGYDSTDNDDSRTVSFIKSVYSILRHCEQDHHNASRYLPNGEREINTILRLKPIFDKYGEIFSVKYHVDRSGWVSFSRA